MRLFDIAAFPNEVLVVDDEVVIAAALGEAFATRGFETQVATTGKEAMGFMANKMFAAFVVDKNLPEMDGIELMRAMRVAQPYCACIMITAYSSKQSAIEAMALGAEGYIEKPFSDIFLVCEVVERAIDKKRSQYEHDKLVEQIRSLLSTDDETDTEVDLFNEVLEWHSGQIVADLKRELTILRQTIAASANPDLAVLAHTEDLLKRLKGVVIDDQIAAVKVRHLLLRVIDSLESNVAVLRKPQ